MKSKNRVKRDPDQLTIPEGRYQELYSPAPGRITSTALNGKKLKYAKMILSEDANVTWKDAKTNQVTTFPLAKGGQFFLVSEIIAVSAGTVLIVHDGEVESSDTSEPDFTGPIYPNNN